MRRVALERRLPVGAEPVPDRGVHFRIWAPSVRRAAVALEGPEREEVPLERESGGYFSGLAPSAGPGSLYRFRLDGGGPYPDPASRFQPRGPHGPSQVVDPSAYRWRDGGWRGAGLRGRVLYELHVGTFTWEGTWEAASRRLPELADLGVTTLEVMPVSDFPGRFGWGYDGCNLYAPTRLYGGPDDFRRFVDAAHACGLGVILDVVYNHFGPDGCYLAKFSADYFRGPSTDWGPGLNYDGRGSAGVRELIVSNAAYWISEYHLDGLRLDATQSIRDRSPRHVLSDVARAARAAAPGRSVILVAENETQISGLARPERDGGCGLDALWNDDFHHSARVALTGRAEAYYSGYAGSPEELVSCLKRGYLFQGQRYGWQDKPRGTPTAGLPSAAFVNYLENHDQLANTLDGRRLHQLCDAGSLRAMTAVLLLGPGTPMLFQGQEYAARSPFLFFADHGGALGEAVRKGRREYMSQFPSAAGRDAQDCLPDPLAPATFERCKLEDAQDSRNLEALALHRDLLRLRREDPVFRAQDGTRIDGAALGPGAFAARWFGAGDDERLLLVNFGPDLVPREAEPLLAPPLDRRWELLWSSERPAYGGAGVAAPVDAAGRWRLAGRAASVLRPRAP